MRFLPIFIASFLMLSGVLVFVPSNASAADAHLDYDGWEWHYDTGSPGTLSRVVQTGTGTEVNIPTNLDGSTPLTTIGDYCFADAQGAKITKVLSMPDTVTRLGEGSFIGMSVLTSVDISSGLIWIGTNCFYDSTTLISITFEGFIAPVSIGPGWLHTVPAGLRGHAYAASDFPAPGGVWNGLTMGAVIPAPSSDYVVFSNLVMDGAGTLVYTAATFAAACTWALGHGNTTTYIPAGSYSVTASISIGSYATLLCDGTLTADSAVHYMISATSKSHINITGGVWDGNKAARATTGSNNPFNFLSCSYVELYDLEVKYGAYDNIEFQSCSHITITDVISHDSNWDSLMMAYTSNSIVQRCHVYDSLEGGVYFYTEDDGIVQHVDYNILRNNVVERTYTSGLSISLRGIEDTGSYGKIENNTCVDCGSDGMHPGINLGWSGASIRYADHCTVIYNEVYQTGGDHGDGILVQCKYSTISFNDVHDIKDCGINVRGNANVINNNQIDNVYGGGYAGIDVWDGNYNRIISNQISNINRQGIWLTISLTTGCNYNYIASNTFTSTVSYNIYIENAGSTQNILEGNLLSGTYQLLDHGTNTQVFGSGSGYIGVQGQEIVIDGVNQTSTFFGVNDPTVLPFAIEAYVNGHSSYWGNNQVFPRPTSSSYQAKIPGVNNISMLWYSYFWLCNYYDIQIVRLGAGETQTGSSWSTAILYNAWHDHQAAFFQVLDEMTKWADYFGIHVILDLAGASLPIYGYGTSGNPLIPGDAAYVNMLTYEKSTIQHFNTSAHNNAIFSFDVFNEPDSNILNTWYWNYWQALFHTWALSMSAALTPQTSHIVEMGVGGYDKMFGFGQLSFNQVTGTAGFDVCDYHYYASSNDTYLFSWPEGWASAVNKPLIYSELGYNAHYPLVRWTYAENQIASYHTGAYISMVLTGTAGYPYTGTYPEYLGPPTIPPTWKPTFTSHYTATAVSGTLWSYTITTNESCTLSLISPPGFIAAYVVGGNTVIRGTPNDGDIGSHPIVLRAVSSLGHGTTWQNFSLVVSAAYVPPPIVPIIPPGAASDILNIAPIVGLLLLFIAPTGMAISYRNDNPKHVVLWMFLMVIILGYFAWSVGAI